MMKNNATEHPRGWRRRAIGVVGALVLAGSALAVTASADASAQDPACNWPPEGGSNTYLTIEPLGNAVYSVHIGIDVEMRHQDAQTIIDAPLVL